MEVRRTSHRDTQPCTGPHGSALGVGSCRSRVSVRHLGTPSLGRACLEPAWGRGDPGSGTRPSDGDKAPRCFPPRVCTEGQRWAPLHVPSRLLTTCSGSLPLRPMWSHLTGWKGRTVSVGRFWVVSLSLSLPGVLGPARQRQGARDSRSGARALATAELCTPGQVRAPCDSVSSFVQGARAVWRRRRRGCEGVGRGSAHGKSSVSVLIKVAESRRASWRGPVL